MSRETEGIHLLLKNPIRKTFRKNYSYSDSYRITTDDNYMSKCGDSFHSRIYDLRREETPEEWNNDFLGFTVFKENSRDAVDIKKELPAFYNVARAFNINIDGGIISSDIKQKNIIAFRILRYYFSNKLRPILFLMSDLINEGYQAHKAMIFAHYYHYFYYFRKAGSNVITFTRNLLDTKSIIINKSADQANVYSPYRNISIYVKIPDTIISNSQIVYLPTEVAIPQDPKKWMDEVVSNITSTKFSYRYYDFSGEYSRHDHQVKSSIHMVRDMYGFDTNALVTPSQVKQLLAFRRLLLGKKFEELAGAMRVQDYYKEKQRNVDFIALENSLT